MDDEKLQRAVKRQRDYGKEFAVLAPEAIKDRVLKMLEADGAVTLDGLIAWFEAEIARAPDAPLVEAHRAALTHLVAISDRRHSR